MHDAELFDQRSRKLAALRSECLRMEKIVSSMADDMTPLNENALRERRAAQARADEILSGFDMRASPPHEYERPLAYRKRLAETLKAFSNKWHDFGSLPDLEQREFSHIERNIYADALEAAKRGDFGLKPGERRMRTRDDAGHTVREWVGRAPGAHFCHQFSRVWKRTKTGDAAALRSLVEYDIRQSQALKRANAAEHALQAFARRVECGTA